MDIFPIVSKYGFRKRNENPVIKTLDTEISNLNRSVKNVNENVKVLNPSIYLKNVKGVELNKDDNLNVSPKNLIVNDIPPPIEPTYQLTSNVNPVDEGISITFTLTTTNVENGNNVPYTITGVSQSDIGGVPLNGNFVVDNNNASITLNISADNLTEDTEYLTLVSGGQTIIVNINDLSKSPVTINFNVYTTDIDYGVFPEGNYIIKYVGGAWSAYRIGDRFKWGDVTIKAGTLQYFFTDGVEYSMAGAIEAGQGKEMTFYHNGGNIKLLLYDRPIMDNRMSPEGMTYSIWYDI